MRTLALLVCLTAPLASCGDGGGDPVPPNEEDGGTIVGRLASVPDGLTLLLPSGQATVPTANGAFVFVDVPAGVHPIQAVGSPFYYDEVIGQAVVEVGVLTDVGTLQQSRDRYVDAVTELEGVTHFQRVIGFDDLDDWAEIAPGEGNLIVVDMGEGEEIENVSGNDFEIGDARPDGPAGEYQVAVSLDGESFVQDRGFYRGELRAFDLADFGVDSARFVKILITDPVRRLGLRFVRTTY